MSVKQFPVPLGPFDLTFNPAPAALVPLDTAEPRSPHVTKLPPFPQITPQPQPYNQNLYSVTAQVALPFNQYDSPKQWDVKQAPFSPDQQLNINLFTNPVPLNQYDFPKAFDVRQAPFSPDQALNINLITIPNPTPFNQVDFPKAFDVRQAPFSPDQALNINLFTNPIPFNQFDFPKQWDIKQAPYSPTDPLNINLFTNPLPTLNLGLGTQVRQRPIVDSSQPYNVNLYGVAVVSVPFNQFDFPKVFDIRQVSLFEQPYNQNLYQVIVQAQSEPRAPYVTKLPPFPQVVPQPQPYNQNLYGIVVQTALPFNQYDFPKAFDIRQAPLSPDQALNINLFTNPYPFNQTDWAKSTDVPRAPVDLSFQLNQNLTNFFPFNQYDYLKPISVPRAPVVVDQALNINTFTNPYPFQNIFAGGVFAPNIDAPSQPYNQNLYTVVITAAPFNQTDFATSWRPKTLPLLPDPLNINLFTNSYPFNQYDYLKPTRTPQARYSPDPTPLNINLFTNPVPFSLFDYPLTYRRRALPLSDIPWNLNLYGGTVAATLPFNQTDWAMVTRPRAFPNLQLPLNINVFTNPLPFSQTDWAKPVRIRHAPYDVTVPVNPNVYKNPFPFNQSDYSHTVRFKVVYAQQPYNQGLYAVPPVITTELHPVKFIGNVGHLMRR